MNLEADIAYGNACDVEIDERPGQTCVAFSANPYGALEALWFCFRLALHGPNPTTPDVLKLVLKNPQNLLAGRPAHNFHPVVRPPGGDWIRLEAGDVEPLPDGRVQIAWHLRRPVLPLEVAFCYPYGLPELETLRRETAPFWMQDTISVSPLARPVFRIANHYGTPGGAAPGFYFIARQHAGETPGSWVLDGLLRRFAQAATTANAPQHVTWCVPLANIDGIEQGEYGKDSWPQDFNRAWQRPHRRAMHYTVQAIQRDIRLWTTRCQPLLGLDFHAPGGTEDDGVYCHIAHPEHDHAQHKLTRPWAALVARALGTEYAAPDFFRSSLEPTRWEDEHGKPQFSNYPWREHAIPAFILEIPYGRINSLVLARHHFQEMGERIASALLTALPSASPTVLATDPTA